MSHSVLIDESNGNGIFAVISSNITANSTNYPIGTTRAVSSEDLSQSLSEYTDAEESMSAPTEFLAEFLSAIMQKNYKQALKYCQLILKYEPNNTTAKEFFPLIQEKLRSAQNEQDDNYTGIIDENAMHDDEDDDEDDDIEYEDSAEDDSASDNSDGSEEDFEDGNNQKQMNSSSTGGVDGIGANSHSDNTTHSYSSLLLEDEDDDNSNQAHTKVTQKLMDESNGNLISASCSDSESPTEPLTQRLAAMLRSNFTPEKK